MTFICVRVVPLGIVAGCVSLYAKLNIRKKCLVESTLNGACTRFELALRTSSIIKVSIRTWRQTEPALQIIHSAILCAESRNWNTWVSWLIVILINKANWRTSNTRMADFAVKLSIRTERAAIYTLFSVGVVCEIYCTFLRTISTHMQNVVVVLVCST